MQGMQHPHQASAATSVASIVKSFIIDCQFMKNILLSRKLEV